MSIEKKTKGEREEIISTRQELEEGNNQKAESFCERRARKKRRKAEFEQEST